MEYLLYSLLSVWVLWIFYLAVMNLQRARDAKTLSTPAYILGLPVLIVGYLLDILVNVFILSFILLEVPKETLVTSRLKRHKRIGGWRGTVAKWIAIHLLNPFDPGGYHI